MSANEGKNVAHWAHIFSLLLIHVSWRLCLCDMFPCYKEKSNTQINNKWKTLKCKQNKAFPLKNLCPQEFCYRNRNLIQEAADQLGIESTSVLFLTFIALKGVKNLFLKLVTWQFVNPIKLTKENHAHISICELFPRDYDTLHLISPIFGDTS